MARQFDIRGYATPLVLLTVLLAGGPTLAKGGAVNSIKSIKTVKAGVDITITSANGFFRQDLPILRIGNRDFTISRSPDNGDPNTLIFTLSTTDFQNARSGEKVTFRYGQDDRNQLDLGVLDKSKRDK